MSITPGVSRGIGIQTILAPTGRHFPYLLRPVGAKVMEEADIPRLKSGVIDVLPLSGQLRPFRAFCSSTPTGFGHPLPYEHSPVPSCLRCLSHGHQHPEKEGFLFSLCDRGYEIP